jgi:hypothetical protein
MGIWEFALLHILLYKYEETKLPLEFKLKYAFPLVLECLPSKAGLCVERYRCEIRYRWMTVGHRVMLSMAQM